LRALVSHRLVSVGGLARKRRASPRPTGQELSMLKKALLAIAAAMALTLPIAGTDVASSEVTRRHQVVLRDGPGDVWKCPGSDCQRARNKPAVDVLRLRALHGKGKLRFRMEFRNLRKKHYAEYWIDIKTKKMERLGVVTTWRKHWDGRHDLMTGEGDPRRSAGFTHKVRYFKDTVTMVIPRALLGNPSWIRVGAVNLAYLKDEVTLEDNPMNHRAVGLTPPFSPRLYRS
jgi:hypothetical protein